MALQRKTLLALAGISLLSATIAGALAAHALTGLDAAQLRSFSTAVDFQFFHGLGLIAVVLVAENLGHIKAVAAMTGRDLDPYLGRAFVGDGIATIVAGAGGGTGVTTYAENIGVMAVTKIYSTLLFVVAACVAIVLGFSPKFGAVIMTIPGPVVGGLSIVVFGFITATGGRIWVENRVDFSRARNLVTAAVTLTVGAGDLALRFGGFTLGGIGTATFGAILLYQLLRDDTHGGGPGRQERAGVGEARDVADGVAGGGGVLQQAGVVHRAGVDGDGLQVERGAGGGLHRAAGVVDGLVQQDERGA